MICPANNQRCACEYLTGSALSYCVKRGKERRLLSTAEIIKQRAGQVRNGPVSQRRAMDVSGEEYQ